MAAFAQHKFEPASGQHCKTKGTALWIRCLFAHFLEVGAWLAFNLSFIHLQEYVRICCVNSLFLKALPWDHQSRFQASKSGWRWDTNLGVSGATQSSWLSGTCDHILCTSLSDPSSVRRSLATRSRAMGWWHFFTPHLLALPVAPPMLLALAANLCPELILVSTLCETPESPAKLGIAAPHCSPCFS